VRVVPLTRRASVARSTHRARIILFRADVRARDATRLDARPRRRVTYVFRARASRTSLLDPSRARVEASTDRARRVRLEMAFSERHRARWGGNVAIAGALLTFCAGTYWYTVRKVRKDEMDLAIERRGGGTREG